jgi:DNA-binding NarL/FixJ family response regulator
MNPVRVGIVDDHLLLLDSFALGLASSDQIEVVGAFTNLADLEEASESVEMDVLVTDLELGPELGTDVVGEITRRLNARVLLTSGTGDVRGVTAALEAGCSGFISKGRSLQEVIAAVLTVGRGGVVFPNDVLADVLSSGLVNQGANLTSRESDVLALLACGRNAAEIADELAMSLNTSRNHIASILSKLGARSQLEAVVYAARAGLVRVGWEQ